MMDVFSVVCGLIFGYVLGYIVGEDNKDRKEKYEVTVLIDKSEQTYSKILKIQSISR